MKILKFMYAPFLWWIDWVFQSDMRKTFFPPSPEITTIIAPDVFAALHLFLFLLLLPFRFTSPTQQQLFYFCCAGLLILTTTFDDILKYHFSMWRFVLRRVEKLFWGTTRLSDGVVWQRQPDVVNHTVNE